MTLHITDSELFTYLGFTLSQQDLLRDFMKEKGFDTGKQLVAWCVRVASSRDKPQDLPLCGCGHHGFPSVHPALDGSSQCTACANLMRFGTPW